MTTDLETLLLMFNRQRMTFPERPLAYFTVSQKDGPLVHINGTYIYFRFDAHGRLVSISDDPDK